MVQLACVIGYIAAPASLIWEVLADFGHPQLLAKSIESCELYGEGVGAIRVVTARGMTIHERLEALDEAGHRLSYSALAAGQMPAPGVKTYLATVALTRLADELTEIEWWSEGEILGPADSIQAHFVALYERAIENIRAEVR